MHILITGGTGFIGRALCKSLLDQQHQLTVLVRDYAAARLKLGAGVTLIRSFEELGNDVRVDAVINLAGAGIADTRWTPARKKVLLDSRLQTTRELVNWCQRASVPPATLISASAIGYYGSGRTDILTEQSAARAEFSHDLCQRWEAEARKAEALGMRVCLLRLGVVLGAGGGMLARLLPFYRLWLGGPIGSGEQMLSWVHRDDVIAAVEWLLANSQTGVFNVTAPQSVSNQQFNDTLAGLLRRPAVFRQPAWLIALMFGEMGDRLLLNGQQVVPQRLQEAGFEFRYADLHSALRACLCDLGLN